MTQQYTPVTWQDETTSQQGTLINAERLNQMQTAHHYADGFEEVDAVPAADPGVAYHKVVYCTADSTFYRWDGTEWTKDIDDETKALLLEHEADHSNPHQVTKAQVGLGNADNTSDQNKPVSTAQAAAIKLVQDYLDAHEANHSNPHAVTKAQVGLGNADNTADADKPISTATQTALDGKVSIIPVTTGVKFYAQTSGGTSLYQGTANAQTGITSVPMRDSSGRIKTAAPSADDDASPKKYVDDGLATKADKATTLAGYGITDAYTKSETDTLLASKADVATTLAGYGITDAYTKTEADTLLGAKANDNAVVHLAGAETIPGAKTFTINRGVAMKATQSYNTFEVSSRGFINNIEANAYTSDGSASDQHFTIGTSYSTASREVWHAIAYAPRVNRGDTSEAQTEMRLSMNINNNNTGEAYLSFGRNDGVSAPDLVLGKFANGTWTPTMVNDALDTYAPMLRTTGNQIFSGIKIATNFYGKQMNVNPAETHATDIQNVIQIVSLDNLTVYGYLYFKVLEDNQTQWVIGLRNRDGTAKEQALITGD